MSALARAVTGAAESLARPEGRGLRGHHATRGCGRSPRGAGSCLSLPRGRSPEAAAAARAGEVRVPPAALLGASRGARRGGAGNAERGAPLALSPRTPPRRGARSWPETGTRSPQDSGARLEVQRTKGCAFRSEIHRAGNFDVSGPLGEASRGTPRVDCQSWSQSLVCLVLGAQRSLSPCTSKV